MKVHSEIEQWKVKVKVKSEKWRVKLKSKLKSISEKWKWKKKRKAKSEKWVGKMKVKTEICNFMTFALLQSNVHWNEGAPKHIANQSSVKLKSAEW